MRTPFFWYYEERFRDWLYPILLTPFSYIYRFFAKELSRVTPLKLSVPVICIGNITAGGAGKTPFVIYLVDQLKQIGKNPHVISRGYASSNRKIRRVDIEKDTAEMVGDEPLLIAKHAPCWVGRSKKALAVAAINAGADIIVMDDGMQNNELAKDITFMVIDGHVAFGNEKLIPAGPLRETLAEGARKASAFMIMNYDRYGVESRLPQDKPIFHAAYVPRENALAGKKVFPFVGLARPEKFLATLMDMEAEIVDFDPYPDHFYYSPVDMERIIARAVQVDALPVTTEKDIVRVPEEFRQEVHVVGVDLSLPDKDIKELGQFLTIELQKISQKKPQQKNISK